MRDKQKDRLSFFLSFWIFFGSLPLKLERCRESLIDYCTALNVKPTLLLIVQTRSRRERNLVNCKKMLRNRTKFALQILATRLHVYILHPIPIPKICTFAISFGSFRRKNFGKKILQKIFCRRDSPCPSPPRIFDPMQIFDQPTPIHTHSLNPTPKICNANFVWFHKTF